MCNKLSHIAIVLIGFYELFFNGFVALFYFPKECKFGVFFQCSFEIVLSESFPSAVLCVKVTWPILC